MKKNGSRSTGSAKSELRRKRTDASRRTSGSSAISFAVVSQDLGDGFEEEEVAPHHRLIDAQLFVEMIDAVLQHAFPAGVGPGQVAVGAKRVENRERRIAVSWSARAGSRGAVRSARFHKPEAAMAAAELSSMRSGPGGTSKSHGGTRLAGQRAR